MDSPDVPWNGYIWKSIERNIEQIDNEQKLHTLIDTDTHFSAGMSVALKALKDALKMEPHKSNDENFHYKGKLFEKEQDFWDYVKEWPMLKTDHETFLREWDDLGKNVWLNIEQRETDMMNFDFNQILEHAWWYILKKIHAIQTGE